MKGSLALENSYNRLRSEFERRKEEKLRRISKNIEEIDEKAHRLKTQLELLEKSRNELEMKQFESFESFRLKAQSAHEKNSRKE